MNLIAVQCTKTFNCEQRTETKKRFSADLAAIHINEIQIPVVNSIYI